MNPLNKNKTILIIFIFLFIVVFLIIITGFFQNQRNKTLSNPDQNLPTPTTLIPFKTSPTPISPDAPLTSDQYRKSMEEINKIETQIIEKEAAVGRILDLLPYTGKNFRMENDYDKAQYVVTIPRGKEQEGNEEFDAFLKQNGIQDRSWIRKELLVIKYE